MLDVDLILIFSCLTVGCIFARKDFVVFLLYFCFSEKFLVNFCRVDFILTNLINFDEVLFVKKLV